MEINRIIKWILLGSIAGLMFCIIPIHGFELRLSWQLASIWLGGLAFTALLSSWWRQAFWLICLVVTARYLPPAYDAYISLLMVAIFLAAVEGFKRLERDHVFMAMRIAAIALLVWIVLQEAGLARTWFSERNAGPFNPNTGGLFLALCMPAFLSGWWWAAVPVLLLGILNTKTTTAMLAIVAGLAIYTLSEFKLGRRLGWSVRSLWGGKAFRAMTAMALMLIGILLFWFVSVDSLGDVVKTDRWIAWKVATRSMPAEMWGRGLGSWQSTFPLLASGDRRLAKVDTQTGTTVLSNYFAQAHNEYVQAVFELGMQALALIMAFLLFVAVCIWRGSISPNVAAGMTALAVGCFGFFVMHEPPTAVLAVAWLGMFERQLKEASQMTLKSIFSARWPLIITGRRKKGLTACLAGVLAMFMLAFTPVLHADDHKTRVITFLSSGTYTAATGYSTGFDVSSYAEGQIFINVTAEADTSMLDVTVQVSPDNTTWYTHTAIAQITATGQYRTAITNYGNYMRIKYVVGGTSFTFSITSVFKN